MRSTAIALVVGALAACGSSGSGDAPGGSEPPNPAGPASDAGEGGGPGPLADGGGDAAPPEPDPATYHDLTDKTRWEAADGTLTGGPTGGGLSAAFDGTRVYFLNVGQNVPDFPVNIWRYDPAGAFTASGSWTKYDLRALDPALGFNGAISAGKYLYFIPSTGQNGVGSSPSGRAVRYDTTAQFDQLSSWTKFDIATKGATAKGYQGGTFDGRYVYFAPNYNGQFHGVAARYDTTAAAFDDASAWSTFDMGTLAVPAAGCAGATFDGRYVYYVALYQGAAVKARVARFDTKGAFGSAASWAAIDVPNVPSNAYFQGATFDGRFVYLVPSTATTPAVRYDTQAAFEAPTSWTSKPLSFIAGLGALFGGIFDRRYVFFLPRSLAPHPLIVRYDTTADFAVDGSWKSYDMSLVDAKTDGLAGGAFDGRYLYLAPNANHMTLRFDAKEPPAMPKTYTGSFF